MRNRFGLTVAMLFLAASSLAAQAPAEKETASATPAGTTFTVPAGWKSTSRGPVTVIDPPEPDTHVAILDVTAKDADAAMAAGWALYQPGFHRPLKLAVPQAARNGWQER